ncbi:nuclear pore complex protein Nup160-like isoform X3 [Dendrobates tinctorius]|uniref:nuclear pore complex protein Nup160-like isoform X3 n=1 Tax=Dendrobates tinctorius TaxID=92724 RepID=UPI003CC9E346
MEMGGGGPGPATPFGPNRTRWPLSALSPLVWMPYSSIDHLLQALEENKSRLHQELREKLNGKLNYYFQNLGDSTSHLLMRRRS